MGADPDERRRVHANPLRAGRFPGSDSARAYFVKCDGQTTRQNDIDRGVVNIIVGFAPLKPAEFVIIELQRIARAGQADSAGRAIEKR